MTFVYNDGGRKAAGYKGRTGDCVVRAIAIATGLLYQTVYDGINEAARGERRGTRKRGISRAGTGVYNRTTKKYLASVGWTWVPTMHIGSGCRVHLTDGELPSGRLIVSVSKHLTAVIDGVIHDTHDPQRAGGDIIYHYRPGTNEVERTTVSGGRCVYGYWQKA